MFNKSFAILFFLFIVFNMYAQEKDFRLHKHRFDVFYGAYNMKVEEFSLSNFPDIMNYWYIDDEYFTDEAYITMKSHMWFNDKWESDVEIGIYDDLEPSVLDVAIINRFYKGLGLKAGIYAFNYRLDGMESFFMPYDGDFYVNHHEKIQYLSFQQKMPLFGPYLGIDFRYEWKRLTVNASLSGGRLFTAPWYFDVAFKKIDHNYRFKQEYRVNTSGSWFCKPELYLACDLISFKKTALGFRARASFIGFSKSFDYHFAQYEWVKPNALDWQLVEFPEHKVIIQQLDFGITLLFK